MIDYSKPPKTSDRFKFRFPDVRIFDLDKGIRAYHYFDGTSPLVTIRIIFRGAGSIHDNTRGLSNFAAQLMAKGTGKRTALDISSEMDSIGASLNISANSDDTVFNLTSLGNYFERALDVLTDIIQSPAFSDDELQRQQKKTIAAINEESADPEYLSQLGLGALLYPGHPYGWPRMGYPNDVASYSTDLCRSWWSSNISNVAPSIVIAGNISQEDALSLIIEHFGSDNTFVAESHQAPDIKRSSARIALLNKKEAVQNSIRLGSFVVGRLHPDFPALQLVNTILGGYFLSRLNELLREKMGLTYGIYSSVIAKVHSSTLIISSSLNQESTGLALEKIFEVITGLSDEPIGEKEFNTAKQYILGTFLRSVESAQQVSLLVKTLDQYRLGPDYFEDFFMKLSDMKPDDLLHVQKKYLVPELFCISASGNAEILTKQLEPYGSVAEMDASGGMQV
jgi:predicted Zn-dependent peptidase